MSVQKADYLHGLRVGASMERECEICPLLDPGKGAPSATSREDKNMQSWHI